ncbi:MAG: hypothetical protein KDA24_08870 [Deltaproteobacteria bacterium]|nr:hypothetical protein [Deltaproteobacteria bacterium]
MNNMNTSILLALLLGLAGCSSPPSGNLIIGDDDDAVGDDDDAVGDDDDSVGDDDDSVGDDDDAAGNPFEGTWFGGMGIFSDEQGFEICEGKSVFEVDSAGDMVGNGSCDLPGGPGGGGDAEFEFGGSLDDEGQLSSGVVLFNRGDSVQEYELGGGVFEEQGDEVLYVTWGMTFGGGGGGFQVTGEGYAWRDFDGNGF